MVRRRTLYARTARTPPPPPPPRAAGTNQNTAGAMERVAHASYTTSAPCPRSWCRFCIDMVALQGTRGMPIARLWSMMRDAATSRFSCFYVGSEAVRSSAVAFQLPAADEMTPEFKSFLWMLLRDQCVEEIALVKNLTGGSGGGGNDDDDCAEDEGSSSSSTTATTASPTTLTGAARAQSLGSRPRPRAYAFWPLPPSSGAPSSATACRATWSTRRASPSSGKTPGESFPLRISLIPPFRSKIKKCQAIFI